MIIEYPTYAPLVKVCKYAPQVGWNKRIRGLDFSRSPGMHKLSPELIEAIKEGKAWTHGLLPPYLLQTLESFYVKLRFDREEEKCFQLHFSRLFDKGLVSTKLQSLSWTASQPLDITSLISALSLPSMNRLYANARVSSRNTVVYQDRTSSVEELELSTSKLREGDLLILLKVPRALKSFTYYQFSNRTTDGPALHGFIRALECVSSSLEFLDIAWSIYYEDPSISSAFWSFSNFASLKAPHINYRLIYGPEPNLAPCIANSLPKTLEVLSMRLLLEGRWTKAPVLDLWRRLLLKKSSTCLSRLRLIGHLSKFELLLPLAEVASTRKVMVARKWRAQEL
ncbi:hypothetical protein CPB86DRAFT_74953 [Serendipita vermifera]|nr:hypothetical protein CPB86DRAFT_74897 [Serendipita vermifera]PVF93885.1 hypothetical protein CPB86DRAFT_74953 [Serendipita vermifera]